MWESSLGIFRQYKKLGNLSHSVKPMMRPTLKNMIYWEEDNWQRKHTKEIHQDSQGCFQREKGKWCLFSFPTPSSFSVSFFLPVSPISLAPEYFIGFMKGYKKHKYLHLYYTYFSWKYKRHRYLYCIDCHCNTKGIFDEVVPRGALPTYLYVHLPIYVWR